MFSTAFLFRDESSFLTQSTLSIERASETTSSWDLLHVRYKKLTSLASCFTRALIVSRAKGLTPPFSPPGSIVERSTATLRLRLTSGVLVETKTMARYKSGQLE